MEASKKEKLEEVAEEVRSCTCCRLCEERENPVVGGGSLDSPLVLVGEAPGRREDEQGKPFVGSAGKLLDQILKKVGIQRDEIFITNVVKCRPPGNRRPRAQEVEACSRHMAAILGIVAPKVIAPMGNSSTGYFMKRFGLRRSNISDVHGRPFPVETDWGSVVLFPLYHPAAVLYNRGLEAELLVDFQRLKGFVYGTSSN
ncbi:MAG: uracil-DNA glycosylase [Candidatus Bathyarchaeota archaeon]|nr:MAG: uracil-DNA glycosylase [Candidatus Bathyarchaeota archaeon]